MIKNKMMSQNGLHYVCYLATKTLMSSIANKKDGRKCQYVFAKAMNYLHKIMYEEQLSWDYIWADKRHASN